MAVNRCKRNPCCGDQTYCTEKIEAPLMTTSADEWVLVPRVPTEEMIEATHDLDINWNYRADGDKGSPEDAWTAMLTKAPAAPTKQAQDVRELVARLRTEQHNDWTDGSWTVSAELADEAATALQTLSATVAAQGEEIERLKKADDRWAACKDLSKQGWAALSDARLWLFVGQPSDIEEAKQNIDLAQASFADTIISSERRAEAAEATITELRTALASERAKVIEECLQIAGAEYNALMALSVVATDPYRCAARSITRVEAAIRELARAGE